jgi:2-amino-4-hydroxy-6-hydroxymethyldihydropteridine diphosphokinase
VSAVTAYIGLGANLDGPAAHIERAFVELDQLPATRLMTRSRLYKSEPLGPPGQPDYLNAVARLETRLEPEALLAELKLLEARHGRRAGPRWGPRPLDLDILLYADVALATPTLTLPHPGMHERAFVLYPLADIAPELEIPDWGRVREIRDRCRKTRIQCLEEDAHD